MAKRTPVQSCRSFSVTPVTQGVAGSSPVRPATFDSVETLLSNQIPEGLPGFVPEGFFVGMARKPEANLFNMETIFEIFSFGRWNR